MRTLTRSKAVAGLAAGLMVAGGGIAAADNLQDNLDTTASQTQTITVGQSVTITYYGGANGSDGCNVDTTASATMALNLPSDVTATAAPTFTACGNTDTARKTVTYSSSKSGTYSIAPTISGGKPGNNGWNPNNARFTLVVKPSVAVSGVTDEAEYVRGAVPSAMCDVTGASTGPVNPFPAALSGSLTNGLGSQTATCDYTDDNGLAADTRSVTYTIVAPANTKPSVSVAGVSDGASYEIGSVPAATCDITDAEDGNSSAPAVLSGTLTHGLGNRTATCDYEDEGGFAADTATATYTIVDTGDPTISGSINPTSSNGANGWYVTAPTVTFTCADLGGSGVASCEVDGGTSNSVTLAEGAGQSVSGTATDHAGNTATTTVSGLNVDLNDPTASFVGGPAQGATYAWGSVPTAPTCTSSDHTGGSGEAGCTVANYSAAVGTHTLVATARDNAGRTGTDTITYTVAPWAVSNFFQPVDMAATNTAKAGSTIPVKFEITSSGTELTALSAVNSVKHQSVSCSTFEAGKDEIEQLSTSTAGLKYDPTNGGQYVYTWKSPSAGCYKLTVTAADGSTQIAYFQLRK